MGSRLLVVGCKWVVSRATSGGRVTTDGWYRVRKWVTSGAAGRGGGVVINRWTASVVVATVVTNAIGVTRRTSY